MNETENNETVKTADDALAYLKSAHAKLYLPPWAYIGLNFVPYADTIRWSIYGSQPRTHRFISTQGATVEECHAEFRTELSGDKLRAEIERLQAQLAQVEGGAA